MISRGVTCDADNQLTSVLQRKHPHELLDSVVKERLAESFVSTEARILQRPVYLSSGYFKKFSKFRFRNINNFNHLRFRSLVSGRRILQRYSLLSTPLFQLPFGFDELKQPAAENCVTLCLSRSFPFRLRRKWGEL